MNYKSKHLLSAAFILVSAWTARADMVTYHVSPETSNTLENLGTKFLAGCTVLALGIVLAAFVSRRK